MQKAIITKNLIGDEPLHYTKEDGWYYCKYFTLAEENCCVEDDVPIIEEDYFYIEDPYNFFFYDNDSYEIDLKTIDKTKNVVYADTTYTYEVPLKFYTNFIERLNCAVFSCMTKIFSEDKPLILLDYQEGLIGWLEPCAFKIYLNDNIADKFGPLKSDVPEKDNPQEDEKIIPQEISDNFIFECANSFIHGFATVRCGDFMAKLDLDGNITKKIFCEDCYFYDEFIDVKIGNKWGVIDKNGNIIIKAKYDKLAYIGEEKWKAKIKYNWGLLDNNENIIIPFKYDFSYINPKPYVIAKTEHLCGVFDYEGNIVIPFEYDYIDFCYKKTEDKRCFCAKKNNKMGIIDINNNVIVPFEYIDFSYLNENIIAAQIDDDKFIIINEKNEQICSKIFEDICPYGDTTSIISAKSDGLWGFIDEQGNTEIDFKYTDAKYFFNGYCEVAINEEPDINDYGLIDKNGTLILDYKYQDDIWVIDDDRFIVKQDMEPFIVDRKGNIIVDKIYQFIGTPFHDEKFFRAELDDEQWGYIDRDGNPLKINKETINITETIIKGEKLPLKEQLLLTFYGKEL